MENMQENVGIFSVALWLEGYKNETQYFIIENEDIKELYFIEDIFSYMITGKLVFNDKHSIFEYGAITTGMRIEIFWGIDRIPNMIPNLSLSLHKINRIIPSGANEAGKSNILELILVEPDFKFLQGQKYSYSWSNTSITSIIKNISKNMIFHQNKVCDLHSQTTINENTFEESDENMDFVMPYWTPLQALNYLTHRASSNGNFGYCLYKRLEHNSVYDWTFNIQTLEQMFQQKNKLTITHGGESDNGQYSLESNRPSNFNRILQYDLSGVDLYNFKELRGGTFIGFNYENKKIIKNLYKFSETTELPDASPTVDNFTLLGNWALLEGTTHRKFNPPYDDTASKVHLIGDNNSTYLRNIYFNDWIKKYSSQNILTITVKGHEQRQIGQLIELIWPSGSSSDLINSNMTGLYLIKGIIHHFSPNSQPTFKQKLVLMRNAYNYGAMSSDVLYPAQKKNIPQDTKVE